MIRNYIIGAAVLAVGVSVWGYGRSQYTNGYEARDARAKTELAALQTAHYNEQMRLADAVAKADNEAQKAKEQTRTRAATLNADLNRMRSKLAAAADKYKASRAASGGDGADTDWIGLVGACWGSYAELGGKAAIIADRVNEAQGYINAVRQQSVTSMAK